MVNFHHVSDLKREVVREREMPMRHCDESTQENYSWKPAGQTNHSRWANKNNKQVSLEKGKILQRKNSLILSLFSSSPAYWTAVADKVFWKEKDRKTTGTWRKLTCHALLCVCLYGFFLFWKHIAPQRILELATDDLRP